MNMSDDSYPVPQLRMLLYPSRAALCCSFWPSHVVEVRTLAV